MRSIVAFRTGRSADLGPCRQAGRLKFELLEPRMLLTGSIQGLKWLDSDFDGQRDSDEPGIPEWTIYLNEIRNGDENGQRWVTETDRNGEYLFPDLPDGTYRVSEELPDGWTQTFPGPRPDVGTHIVDVPGDPTFAPRHFDFGNVRSHQQHGPRIVSHDPSGEIPSAVHEVSVTFDEPIEPRTFTPEDVNVSIGFLEIYVPVFAVKAVDDVTFLIEFGGPDVALDYHVRVGPHIENLAGIEMDQDRDGEPGEPHEDIYDAGFVVVEHGTIQGAKWDDDNGNGLWESDEPGLEDWTIYVDQNGNGQRDTGEPFHVTGPDGAYAIEVTPGQHTVAEQWKPGWQQTFPWVHGGPQFQVNSTPMGPQSQPAVAADAEGNFVVVGFGGGCTGFVPFLSARMYRADGTPAGDEFQVNSLTIPEGAKPTVARDAVGNFVIAWTGREPNGDGPDIYARAYDADGNPQGLERRINTTTAGRQSMPSAAMAPGGDLVIAWVGPASNADVNDQQFDVFARVFRPEMSSLSDEFQVNSFTNTGRWSAPSAAMDRSGNVAIAWAGTTAEQQDFGRIYTRLFDRTGEPMDTEFRVDTTNWDTDAAPSVAMDSDGNFTVIWNSDDMTDGPGYADVHGQVYCAGGTAYGGEFQVNSDRLAASYHSSLAMRASGDFVVAWTGEMWNENRQDVYARMFLADGTPLGQELVANVDAEGAQRAPAVAMGNTDRFVVAWAQSGDANASGVFARQFRGFGSAAVYQVDVQTGQAVESVNFGNKIDKSGARIQGSKFNDRDGNGVWGDDEPGLPDWTVYLDMDVDGRLDPGEPQTLTDRHGDYEFADLKAGTYVVAEVLQDGWRQMSPPPRAELTGADSRQIGDGAAIEFGISDVQVPDHTAEYPWPANSAAIDVTLEVVWPSTHYGLQQDVATFSIEGDEVIIDLYAAMINEYALPVVWTEYQTVTIPFPQSGVYTIHATLHEAPSPMLPAFVPTWIGTGEMIAQWGGRHLVRLADGEIVRDVDFGNRRIPCVKGRHVFYHNSTFDDAMAPGPATVADPSLGKAALLPGQTATFQNYTSYDRGINGLMVDVAGLGDPEALTAADFQFRVGNSDDLSSWAIAPPPMDPGGITVRQVDLDGDEVPETDRITIIWADGAIKNQWLEVRVKPTVNTGLHEADVFYFGNAIGESGDASACTFVDGADFAGARDNTHDSLDRAPLDDRFDYNRDSLVDGTDLAIARDNQTNFLTCLTLITVPPLGGSPSSSPSNCSSSSTVQLGGCETMALAPGPCLENAEKNGLSSVPVPTISGSDWPTRLLLDRSYLLATPRQPADLPQQRTEDLDLQTVSAVFQNLQTDGSAVASDSALMRTGDRWADAVGDCFLSDDNDLFGNLGSELE